LATLPWYHGSRIDSVERRGKTVIVAFSRAGETRFLVAELGMTGLLLLRAVPVRFPQHVHFVLTLEDRGEPELRYWNPRRFGRLYLFDPDQLIDYSRRRFGYDPLTMTLDQLANLITTSRSRLKSLLMHQQKLAGIGNIYANEILFRAGLHPNRTAARLRPDETRRLYESMQDVLFQAIQCGGSSVRDYFAPNGTLGTFRLQHRVYGKSGQPCPNNCGQLIRRLSQERSTFCCPLCQPRHGHPRRLGS
jgi:formamidopyrimidine-DNA glycosylase